MRTNSISTPILNELTGKQSDFLAIIVRAAARGDLAAVRKFVDEDPSWLHTVGAHGRTMLWEAARRGRADVVEFLIERGADVNICGCHLSEHFVEVSPYCVAKSAGHDELADCLLRNGATIDIHSAAYLGDRQQVLSFLEHDPSLANAAHPQHDKQRQVRDRLVFEPGDESWAMPLHYAVSGGHKDVVELLIALGAVVAPHSSALLAYVVRRDRLDLLNTLLEHGADAREAPMADPVAGRAINALLQSHGAVFDLNSPGEKWPPLIYASRGDKGEHPQRVRALLELGADVNIRDYKGKTALHRAASAGFTRVMAALLAHGADIDAADCRGETALFDAIRARRKDAVALLLSNGATPHVRNHKEATPLRVARRAKSNEAAQIAALLQEYEPAPAHRARPRV